MPEFRSCLVAVAACAVLLGCRSKSEADVEGGRPSAWPMPNASSAGLPHPQSYSIQSTGAEQVVVDDVTKLSWQRSVGEQSFVWADAKAHCQNLSYAGFDDWRLPTRIELVSLLDVSRTDPSVDTNAFPVTPSEWYWTSTPWAEDASKAWYGYFYFGYPDLDDVGNALRVRCTRGRAPSLAPRYELARDTARDVATGLVWQRGIAPEQLSFDAAAAYCRALRLGGELGFRVPSMKELETLVDERRTNPAIDLTAFPETPGEPFWSSSAWAGTGSLAWYVRFSSGSALYDLTNKNYRVRCVR